MADNTTSEALVDVWSDSVQGIQVYNMLEVGKQVIPDAKNVYIMETDAIRYLKALACRLSHHHMSHRSLMSSHRRSDCRTACCRDPPAHTAHVCMRVADVHVPMHPALPPAEWTTWSCRGMNTVCVYEHVHGCRSAHVVASGNSGNAKYADV